MLKKTFALLTSIAFIGQVVSMPVFSQTGKKSTTRKASNTRASTKTSTAARSTSRTGTRGLGAGKAISRIASTTTTTSSTSNCLAQFIDCMDAQIDTTIANYPYLADDEAVQAMQDTQDPLRCIYYNAANVEGLFSSGADTKYCSSDLVSTRNSTTVNSKGQTEKSTNFNNFNVCSNQKDVNDLYMSYNYYCDLNTSDVGVSGMPINKCDLKQSTGKNKNDVFATKDSYAYYNEANRRVSAGELKIINFEKTKLFTDKISKLGLENWDKMSLKSDTVSDLLDDLGLTNNEEIFSINVVPPVGAGNLNPGSQYEKAKNICFGTTTFKIAGKTATEKEKNIQSAISYLSKNCTDSATRTDLERYYIAGTSVKLCDDGYIYNSINNKCIYTGKDEMVENEMDPHSSDEDDVELEQTDFLSAKASCDLYEQTLISTRNKAYADFDTQLKNYIDDEVAKLIKNKTKSLSTIANAFGNLQQTDAQISIDDIQRKSDIITSKTEAQISVLDAENNLLSKQLEATSKTFAVQNELKSLISSNFSKQISNACLNSANKLIEKLSTSNVMKITNDFAELSVKLDAKGNVKYREDSDYATLNSSEYQEFYCSEVEGFDISQLIEEKVEFGECASSYVPSLLGTSGKLPIGIFKIALNGAGGGGGGKSVTTQNNGKGGDGGNGARLEKIFVLSQAEDYTAEIGKGGSGGGTSTLGKKAGNGGDGEATVFNIMGIKYTADGGKGGEGGGGGSGKRYHNGSDGAQGGNGEGAKGGDGGTGSYEGGDKGSDGSIEVKCMLKAKSAN